MSICLINECKMLNIVEITPTHYEVIKNNLKVYNFDESKYNIINDDYMNVMMNLEQDVIIADVPWGGYSYKLSNNINLGLNNVNIVCIINKLVKFNRFKLFILLIPYNYDKKYFENNIDKNVKYSIKRINNSKHYIIIIKN